MQKVHIVGKLKTSKKQYFKTITKVVDIDKVGWLKDRVLFYPDKDNAREYYKIVSHKSKWDNGILYSKLEILDVKKIVQSTCKACKPKPKTTPKEVEEMIRAEKDPIEEIMEEDCKGSCKACDLKCDEPKKEENKKGYKDMYINKTFLNFPLKPLSSGLSAKNNFKKEEEKPKSRRKGKRSKKNKQKKSE